MSHFYLSYMWGEFTQRSIAGWTRDGSCRCSGASVVQKANPQQNLKKPHVAMFLHCRIACWRLVFIASRRVQSICHEFNDGALWLRKWVGWQSNRCVCLFQRCKSSAVHSGRSRKWLRGSGPLTNYRSIVADLFVMCALHILLSVTPAVCWSIGMLFLPKLSSYVA